MEHSPCRCLFLRWICEQSELEPPVYSAGLRGHSPKVSAFRTAPIHLSRRSQF